MQRRIGRLLLVALVAAMACRPRVLVVGLDGADLRVLDVLRDGGHLPTIDALLDAGAVGTVDCVAALPSFPCYCPPVWTSIATGQPTEVHGIQNVEDPASLRQVKALWTVLKERGGKSHLYSYRNSWPPEAEADAVVTEPGANFASTQVFDPWPEPTGHPGFSQPETHFKPVDLLEQIGLLPFTGEPLVAYAPMTKDRIASWALDLVTQTPDIKKAELTMIIWHSIDRSEHASWESIQATPADPLDGDAILAEAGSWSGPVFQPSPFGWGDNASQYLEVDQWLAGHLALRTYDFVVFVSDHGMARNPNVVGYPGVHGVNVPDAHRALFGVWGSGVQAGAEPDPDRTVMDVGVTIAYLLNIAEAQDLAGRVMTELFTDERLDRKPVRTIASWE